MTGNVDKTRLWTVNRLSDELGLDRRTIRKRLTGLAPAAVAGRARYFELAEATTAILGTAPEPGAALTFDEWCTEVLPTLEPVIKAKVAADRQAVRDGLCSPGAVAEYARLALGLGCDPAPAYQIARMVWVTLTTWMMFPGGAEQSAMPLLEWAEPDWSEIMPPGTDTSPEVLEKWWDEGRRLLGAHPDQEREEAA